MTFVLTYFLKETYHYVILAVSSTGGKLYSTVGVKTPTEPNGYPHQNL